MRWAKYFFSWVKNKCAVKTRQHAYVKGVFISYVISASTLFALSSGIALSYTTWDIAVQHNGNFSSHLDLITYSTIITQCGFCVSYYHLLKNAVECDLAMMETDA